jgi:hypothetical protein
MYLIKEAPWYKEIRGSGGIAPPFLTSTLDEGEWSASHSSRFPSREKELGTRWIWDLVGPRAGLDAVEERRITCPCQESNPGPPPRRYTDLAIAHKIYWCLTEKAGTHCNRPLILHHIKKGNFNVLSHNSLGEINETLQSK